MHFLGLEATDDPLRWRLPVTPAVCTPGRFLYGGCGLAAGIVALEEAVGRPTVWATAQYLTYAPTGTVLDWEVVLAAVGRNTTQGRAIGRLGDEEVLTVNAALGLTTWTCRARGWTSASRAPARGLPAAGDPAHVRRHRARTASNTAWPRAGSWASSTAARATAHSAFWARVPGHLEPRPPPWP